MASVAEPLIRSATATSVSAFIPRSTFPTLHSLPRSYFLGHHAAALQKMKQLLNQIDLVIECRDARMPLTSRNPTLDSVLSLSGSGSRIGRIVVYTKADLVPPSSISLLHEHRTRLGDANAGVHLSTTNSSDAGPKGARASRRSAGTLLSLIRDFAKARWSLTGARVLVAGMPNVGKSTLLNALRAHGMGRGKAARTGGDPGVTRSVSGAVKIIDGSELDGDAVEVPNGDEGNRSKGQSAGVYMLDTPGVFMPYVSDPEAMLKLALCGSVKDGLIPPLTLADYLLFRLNLDPRSRKSYVQRCLGEDGRPTNDVTEFLDAAGRRSGRLIKGGKGRVDLEGTAVHFVKRWRKGELGTLCLDDMGEEELRAERQRQQASNESGVQHVSISQARKANKETQKQKMRDKAKARRML